MIFGTSSARTVSIDGRITPDTALSGDRIRGNGDPSLLRKRPPFQHRGVEWSPIRPASININFRLSSN